MANPHEKNKYPIIDTARHTADDIGFGYYLADCFVGKFAYFAISPKKGEWYKYDGSRWKPDMGDEVAQQTKLIVRHLKANNPYSAKLNDVMAQLQGLVVTDFTGAITSTGDMNKKIELENLQRLFEKAMQKWDKKSTTAQDEPTQNRMIKMASSECRILPDDVDADKMILNVRNKTMNLQRQRAQKQKHTDKLTKMANVTFVRGAKCERWEKFIDEIMCGDKELARYLQKALGYGISGQTHLECFFIAFGRLTRNGKGTLFGTIQNIMGDYCVTLDPEHLAVSKNLNAEAASPTMARLAGARIVLVPEPEKGMKLSERKVKQMTGRDTMDARRMYQETFTFMPQFKLFFHSNFLPSVKENTLFKSRRVKIIPFERHFDAKSEDAGLKDYFLTEEAKSGILNWLLEGYKMFVAEGLQDVKAVIDAVDGYQAESDIIMQFVNESLVKIKSEDGSPLQDVFEEYKKWCDESNIPAKGKNNFSKELKERGIRVAPGYANTTTVYGYGISAGDDLPVEWR